MTPPLPEPDDRPGYYYVSVRDGHRWSLLYGPFGRHADALAAVEATRRAAERLDARAVWYAFGTARLAEPPAPDGILNDYLPPIRSLAGAESLMEEHDATTTIDG